MLRLALGRASSPRQKGPFSSSYFSLPDPFEIPRCLMSHGTLACGGTVCDPPMISLRPLLFLALALQAGIAQQSEPLRLTPSGPVLPDEQQIRATIGKDADTLIPDVLAYSWAVRSTPNVNVIAEQFPATWLPRVSNVRFTRIPLEVAKRGWVDDCLRLLWLTASVNKDSLVFTVRQGNRCSSSWGTDTFDRSPGGWQRRGGIGAGGVSGGGDCGCKVE